MTIAITGATSMLGVATIKSCIKNNVNVIAFVHKNSVNIKRIPKSNLVNVIFCDLSELMDVNTKEMKADVFIHFGWSYTDKVGRKDIRKQMSNVSYTIDAVDLASKLECKKFIGVGSQAEYGTPNEELCSSTSCNPLIPYGIAKYAAGKLSEIACDEKNMTYIWVRVLSVFGSNDSPNTLISQLIYNIKHDIPMNLSGCEQIWDYLYEEDAGEAFFAIATNTQNSTIYNLGSGKSKKLKEYVIDLCSILNPKYIPNFGYYPYSPKQPFVLKTNISNLTKDTGWIPKIDFSTGIKNIVNNM